MRFFAVLILTVMISIIHTSCYAISCNCEDWMERGGYCVDYVKSRIPSFPIPYRDDMPTLKNQDVADVTEGDVAIFAIDRYWHVSYVEKVHRGPRGEATALDVSEMNLGDGLSFAEFRSRWNSTSPDEWSRAVCCGVTENYGRLTFRRNVDIDTVTQLWSPDDAGSGRFGASRLKAIVGKVREVINRFRELTEREL